MKARGDAKLKTLPDALQERFFQELRTTSIAKALEWLRQNHGIDSSASAASEFFRWYPRVALLRQSASMADELKDTIKKLPELRITADQAAAIAQTAFEIQAARDRDPGLFAALRKGELETQRLRLEREKFEHQKKEDWEHGLDALLEEIKGNADALRHFEAMKAALKKGRD